MKNFQSRIAVCNQKGGVGKSTFTVLIASYLHYNMGHDVLVMDCDYPQWSIHAQRERELHDVMPKPKHWKSRSRPCNPSSTLSGRNPTLWYWPKSSTSLSGSISVAEQPWTKMPNQQSTGVIRAYPLCGPCGKVKSKP